MLRSVIGSAPEFPGCLKIPGLLEVSGTVFSFSSASFFKEIRIIRLHERFRTASFFLAVAAPLLLGACIFDGKKDSESADSIELVAQFAGTWAVDSIYEGTHARGTVIIGADGSIDFDTGLSFTPEDFGGHIYDRLHVTSSYGPRIQIEIVPQGELPQRRIRLFVDLATGNLATVAYYATASETVTAAAAVSPQ